MMIVGMISGREEAFEIQYMAKCFVIARRFNELGKLSRLQNIKKCKVKDKKHK